MRSAELAREIGTRRDDLHRGNYAHLGLLLIDIYGFTITNQRSFQATACQQSSRYGTQCLDGITVKMIKMDIMRKID